MIVDTHTHLWQNLDQLGPQISAQLRQQAAGPWEQMDASPHNHEAAMHCVDAAFVLGFRSRMLGADVPNQLLAAYVASNPDKLIGFAGIDPMVRGWQDELEQLTNIGMSGVVISPAEQGYHPTHSEAMKLYERCQALGLPVVVHQGNPFARDSMLEHARPYLFDEVARCFPRLRLMLTQCGHPWMEETLVVVSKHRNIFAGLSGIILRPWQLYNLLLQAHQLDVTDRLLLGSDFPHASPEYAIEMIYTVNRFAQGTAVPSVPREKLRAIVERNALEAMGLAAGPSGSGIRPQAPRALPRSAGHSAGALHERS
ncbi:MAG: amidohydrolase family protein [Phycisphaeraceae bacterium]